MTADRLGWNRNGRTDRGSALVFGVGLVAICLLAGVAAVDVAAAHLQRRNLLALADAAALAGAQAIDLDAYYRDGASAATTVDPGQVSALVRAHLIAADAAGSVDAIAVDRVYGSGGDVVVRLSAPLRLPFWPAAATAMFGERVVVEAHARLAYRADGA